MSLNVKASIMKGLEEMLSEHTRYTVKQLAVKYGFNEREALAELEVAELEVREKKVRGGGGGEVKAKEAKEGKEKIVKEKKCKPKIVLPYCGRILAEWCEGIKLNHGLYSQCTSEKIDDKYCKSCKKQATTNEAGKPTQGNINERMNMSNEAYRAFKGKKCVVYAVVLRKLKLTKEEAIAEATKFGLEIPEEEFELPKSQRGRPKKVSESESVKSGSDEGGEKKRRGRPKKNKTMAENQTDETDDLIASLVAEANALKSANVVVEEEEVVVVVEEEAVEEKLLKGIVAKINADETFNNLNTTVVPKNERQKMVNTIGEHIKTILTEEEMTLFTGVPNVTETEEEEEVEEEEVVEDEEEVVEDEATRKAREAAEKKEKAEAEKKAKKEQADAEKKAKKEQADAEKKAKKEQADAEKKAKKEQADAEKKAKTEADKKAKAEADAENKIKAEAEKKAKKEQADAEKKAKADAELEKKANAKKAEVNPVVKTTELEAEVVEEPVLTKNVTIFEFEGKKYKKTEEGILYDIESEEEVGVWNEETQSIDDFADDEE